MKKLLSLIVCCSLSLLLLAQTTDSIDVEMQRLKRMGDSIYKAGLARDSAFREKMDRSLREVRQEIAKSKQKETDQLTEQVLSQHRKEQRRKRMAAILTIAAFSITGIIGALIARRRKQEKIRKQQYY